MAIIWTGRFEKAFKSLNQAIQRKVLRALLLLDENPRHPSQQIKRVQGTEGIWEAWVDLQYRLTFQMMGEDKILRNVDSHDKCLRKP